MAAVGQQGLSPATSPHNATSFVVQQMLGRISTVKMVKVMGVDTGAGTVDVQPLVNQIDGAGNSQAHGTVYGLPYFRYQSGTVAIIVDPTVGDMGLVVVCDRDSSAAKANKGTANPGSYRRFSLSDGIYLGGILNAEPTRWVKVTDSGIDIKHDQQVVSEVGSTKLTVGPSGVIIEGALVVNGTLLMQGSNDILFQASSLSFLSHFHHNVAGNTGGPL